MLSVGNLFVTKLEEKRSGEVLILPFSARVLRGPYYYKFKLAFLCVGVFCNKQRTGA